jgi:hypothetical protein
MVKSPPAKPPVPPKVVVAVPTATVTLSDFAWTSLSNEAARQGVPLEDLLNHAAMYYLADLDSGRIATKVPPAAAEPDDRAIRFERRRTG